MYEFEDKVIEIGTDINTYLHIITPTPRPLCATEWYFFYLHTLRQLFSFLFASRTMQFSKYQQFPFVLDANISFSLIPLSAEDLSASVSAYDAIVSGSNLASFLSLSKKIGGDVATQADMVEKAFAGD